MLMRPSPEDYSGVAEGNIFSLLAGYYMRYSLYYMACPTTYSSPAHLKYQNFISLIVCFCFVFVFVFAQISVREQVAMASCHGVTDVSMVLQIPN